MENHTTGEIGYHEAAKRLIKTGHTIGRPELDRGSDMIVCKDKKCIPVQIKTCYFDGREKVTTTWSGSKNTRFDEGCNGAGLMIVALDKDMNHIYSLVFSPEEVPNISSMALYNEVPKEWKYMPYLNNFDSIMGEKNGQMAKATHH